MLQLSFVQGFPSSQVSSVHGCVSSQHGRVLCAHVPVAGYQESLVVGMPSSQFFSCSLHSPLMHIRVQWFGQPVELTPSSFVWMQPPTESHISSVHGFPSSQASGGPSLHWATPPSSWHVS